MRAVACFLLLLTFSVHGRILSEQTDLELGSDATGESRVDPIFALGGGEETGSVQITGMLQNFELDQDPINMLLNRPRTSYLDVPWSKWVDQRLELLDLFQDLLSAPSRPRCPHMQATSSAMDNGMVSYLASSRFGPAILTTYNQQGEEEVDFDYDTVNIPASSGQQRSYEDASLQDEMSADADKAFELAEIESRMLSQEPNLGYFGANVKNQIMISNLDEESENVQPVIFAHPTNFLDLIAKQQELSEHHPKSTPLGQEPEEPSFQDIDPKQLAIFCLLLIGCIYVWTCLFISCCKFRHQKADDKPSHKTIEEGLLEPLAPESFEKLNRVEIAAEHASAERL